ncbi:MAG: hypothetical protein ACK4F9_07215, partial [Brevinematia bacterium]
MDIIDIIITLNIGFSTVTFLSYLSVVTIALTNGKYKNFHKTFLSRTFSNLLLSSILSVFMINTAFHKIYEAEIFEFLGHITLSFSLFVSPLIVNLSFTKNLYFEKIMLVIYTFIFSIVFFILTISYSITLESLKLLV